MFLRLVVPTILSLGLMHGVAFAEGTTSNTSRSPAATQTTQSIPQQVQQKLRDQGFTEVKVVPGSLLVSAKDKQGDPVTMIIGPNSMTVFTISSSGDSATVGSGSDQRGQSGTQREQSGNK